MSDQSPFHKVVFLDRAVLPDDICLRRPRFPHEWLEYPSTSPDLVVPRLRGATIALTNRVRIAAPELQRLPSLRLISVAATGYDMVDVLACRELGVAVANLRDWCTDSVAEHAFGLILALRRQLFRQKVLAGSGEWRRASHACLVTRPLAVDLRGCTLGIVGSGAIGSRVASLGRAFGMQTLHAEHKGSKALRDGRAPFEDVLRESDIVSLHCPLRKETQRLIGRRELRLMRRESVLINCARGGLIDEQALSCALRQGWIGGAGLDGLSMEPPRPRHPLLKVDLPNLIVTPHVAWASQQALASLSEQLVRNLEAFVEGRIQNLVDEQEPRGLTC